MRWPKLFMLMAVIVAVFAVLLDKYIDMIDEAAGLSGGTPAIVTTFLVPLQTVVLLWRSLGVELYYPRHLEAALSEAVAKSFAPHERFASCTAPNVPDYALEGSWAALPLPGRLDGSDAVQSDELPPPVSDDPLPETADVFYLHPTSKYISSTGCWNVDVNDSLSQYLVGDALIPHVASIFNAAGRVHAPLFRHMIGIGYLSDHDEDKLLAMDLAYSDVRRAFEHFLEHFAGSSRKLIIAGHSQGSELAHRLLVDFFDNDSTESVTLRQRLVAGYLVGMPVWESTFKNLRSCKHESSTGCIVAWQTYAETANPDIFQVLPATTGLRKRLLGEPKICVNPISGRKDNNAIPASMNPGSRFLVNFPQNLKYIFGETSMWIRIQSSMQPLQPNVVGARCDQEGNLRVERPLLFGHAYWPFPIWTAFSFPPGDNYHPYDFNFYWLSTRIDAHRRTLAHHHK